MHGPTALRPSSGLLRGPKGNVTGRRFFKKKKNPPDMDMTDFKNH